MLEKTLESYLDSKETQPVHPKGDQSWLYIGRTDAEAETPILLATWCKEKRPWCWERLKAGGEGDNRGWEGWMVSPTQWTWVWVGSGNWWWTRKPGVLWSMGSQRVGHDCVTEVNWTELTIPWAERILTQSDNQVTLRNINIANFVLNSLGLLPWGLRW